MRSRRASPWRDAIAHVALGQTLADGSASDADSLVVQLHGRLDKANSLVVTRSQYRKRLYVDPAYLTVLRSLFATSKVLFLGYLLTDAYLNELRSELVEAFSVDAETAGHDAGQGNGTVSGTFLRGVPAGEPLAWAVLEDVSDVACRYYERYEGLNVIPYCSGDDGRDHSGFDAILKAIYDHTNPIHCLGELPAGRSVLWFDPNPDHNNRGRELLRAAAVESGDDAHSFGQRFEERTTLDAASNLLHTRTFNLVIRHWGHGMYAPGRANGEELLRRVARLRADGIAVPPVVIFAGGGFEAQNRRRALALGAAEFVSRWEDLIAVQQRVLGETFSAP